jgi:hypothetical protein
MSLVFPNQFQFKAFTGPRGRSFSEREDAFQQLVGDALRAAIGSGVFVAPTRGQDGSIDAYVVQSSALAGPFAGLPSPFIVECKDHDDTLINVARNILSAWGDVQSKLQKQADAGWPGLFAPWTGIRSYAYCVSATFPTIECRQQLTQRIENFFQQLPSDRRPEIETIKVIDWAELRDWLGGLSKVADAWLGIGLESIVSHDSLIADLTGFRRYLLSTELEFVAPSDAAPYHPKQLLSHLSKTDRKPGVLIAGVGGAGKTRTVIEVANIAQADGWRVLHVLPGEPVVTVEALADAVLPHPTRTLLIMDYLDQMAALDLGDIRRKLLPEAARRGQPIALLANCRPAWLQQSNVERDELFELRSFIAEDTQVSRITHTIIDHVAPTALQIIGRSEMERVCGRRPSISLLIAREVERRVKSGVLSNRELATVRTGDLTHWLRRRLAEDGLIVPPSKSPLIPADPDPHVVAAAAALACAPDTRDRLAQAATLALEELRWEKPEHAEHIVDALQALGWLDLYGIDLQTAHDVVADEVFEQIALDGSRVRLRELRAVLNCGTQNARTLGRLATALGRLQGAIQEEERAQAIEKAAADWLRMAAGVIGSMLRTDDPDASSYALGAVLAGPPWQSTAVSVWEALIQPWLDTYRTNVAARHCIYRGLRGLAEETASSLIVIALQWLHTHGLSQNASYILQPLLGRSDLKEEQAAKAIDQALLWLGSFGLREEAGFVLQSLLDRSDLKEEQAAKAIDQALLWLGSFGLREEAGFVLQSLLDRSDLKEGREDIIIRLALSWLALHFELTDAEFVLRFLLRRNTLSNEEAVLLIRAAIERLRLRVADDEATFLLRWCLQCRFEDETVSSALVAVSLNWLDTHPHHPDVDYVSNRILRRPKTSETEWLRAASYTIRWLRGRGRPSSHRDYAFNSILTRPDLLDVEDLVYVTSEGIEWLKTPQGYTAEAKRRLNHNLQKACAGLSADHPLVSQITEMALQISEELRHKRSPDVTDVVLENLSHHARSLEQPQREVFDIGCHALAERMVKSPAYAAYLISPLVVLALRLQDPAIDQVDEMLRAILSDSRLQPRQRAKLAEACTRLLIETGMGENGQAIKWLSEHDLLIFRTHDQDATANSMLP